ncbi:hypothetical protein MAPG_08368 [Magnaporthiopsis poae ATCC 64411]|uniref:Uncharacterized protein n=1 Tax=Magnaporthiopsis poae (strain ATCC 64411 / 73-15) TaxID=644358 RepID=A0A0C4E766_MAGP6|nr:hypothetical protein MAPG_08368 [Magnaporthiopsis poae ATCC 64411]
MERKMALREPDRLVAHRATNGDFWGHDGRWVRLARSCVEGAAAVPGILSPANGITAIRGDADSPTSQPTKMRLGKEQPAGKEAIGLASQDVKGSEEGVVGWTARGRTRAVRAERGTETADAWSRASFLRASRPRAGWVIICERGAASTPVSQRRGGQTAQLRRRSLSRIGSRNHFPRKRGEGGQRAYLRAHAAGEKGKEKKETKLKQDIFAA